MARHTADLIPLTHTADTEFRRNYIRWMAVHAVAVALPGPVMAVLAAFGSILIMADGTVIALAGFGAALLGAGVASLSWLRTHYWLERLSFRVHARTQVGMERLSSDDLAVMRDGVGEVIFEWRHVFDETLKKNLAAFVLAIASGGLAMVVLAGALLFAGVGPHLLGLSGMYSAMFAAVLAALEAGALVSAVLLSRAVYRSACFKDAVFDPTPALQSRLAALIAEVKDLRRAGGMRAAA